jgi:hypothetical protein
LDLRFVGIVVLSWRGRLAEARIALLRDRMGEVYAVPGAAAPAPSGAYPVRHEYVGTVPVRSFDVEAHSG